jgi:hypothetical protein
VRLLLKNHLIYAIVVPVPREPVYQPAYGHLLKASINQLGNQRDNSSGGDSIKAGRLILNEIKDGFERQTLSRSNSSIVLYFSLVNCENMQIFVTST